MTRSETLQVRKENLAQSRLLERELRPLDEGEVLLEVDRFAITANNITYAVVGEKFGYWKFFPADEGWGVIPVWGFADVVESRHPEVAVGERLYGYLPMATHLVLRPGPVRAQHLLDAAPHRAALPPVYNSYARTGAETGGDASMEDERMLLFPLYATSYCLADFLSDNGWFDAKQVVITSASSKTSIGLALALRGDPSSPPAVGLTSSRHLDWVRSLGCYDGVFAYDDLHSIDATMPTVIADMSGNGTVLSALHAHLGDKMRHCATVGVTHYEATGTGPGYIAERSALFFAPAHIQKRNAEWGPGVFQQRALEFWREAARQSRSWLEYERMSGLSALQSAYERVRSGEAAPNRGIIVEFA